MGTEYRSREITLQHWDYILSEFRFGVGCGCKLVFWQTEARYIWLNSGTRRDKRVRNAVPYLSQVAVGNKGRPDKCNRRSCTGNTERTYLHRAQLEIKKDILRTEPFQFLMKASLPSLPGFSALFVRQRVVPSHIKDQKYKSARIGRPDNLYSGLGKL